MMSSKESVFKHKTCGHFQLLSKDAGKIFKQSSLSSFAYKKYKNIISSFKLARLKTVQGKFPQKNSHEILLKSNVGISVGTRKIAFDSVYIIRGNCELF